MFLMQPQQWRCEGASSNLSDVSDVSRVRREGASSNVSDVTRVRQCDEDSLNSTVRTGERRYGANESTSYHTGRKYHQPALVASLSQINRVFFME